MRSSPVQRHFQKRPSSQPQPAAINTDVSGLCRTNCSQAHAAPWTFSCACPQYSEALSLTCPSFSWAASLMIPPIFCRSAHFLQVFSHVFRLFAKLITCGRHVSSSSVKKHEIARRGATSEDCLQ